MPQESEVSFSFTVMEVVLMGRFPHLGAFALEGPPDVSIARSALAAMDLNGFEVRRFNELSGGEKQRVVLSRALAQQTPVVLLDEPTSALDYAHQVAVYRHFRRLAEGEGRTVVAVTHDLNLAAQFADTVLFLQGGCLRWCGTPEEVITQQHLAQVYGTSFHLGVLPGSGKPYVVPHGG